jgi:hypothetical protein
VPISLNLLRGLADLVRNSLDELVRRPLIRSGLAGGSAGSDSPFQPCPDMNEMSE